MTDEERIKLEMFETHFRTLMERYKTLKEEKEVLTNSLAQKEAEINALKQQNADLESQYNNLKLARIISISDQDLESSKKRIAKLVRDVDKCIALLNT